MDNPAVTYAAAEHQGLLFWIKRLKLLRKANRLQVIQNKRPWCSAAAYVTELDSWSKNFDLILYFFDPSVVFWWVLITFAFLIKIMKEFNSQLGIDH